MATIYSIAIIVWITWSYILATLRYEEIAENLSVQVVVIGVALTQGDIDKGCDRYQHKGKLHQFIQPHTPQSDWAPDITPALWKEVSLEEYPEWKQPTGAHDAYAKSAKVKHNGKKWISTVDDNVNVWEPGVYGWDEVVE